MLKTGKHYWTVLSHEIIHIILDERYQSTGIKYRHHGSEFKKFNDMNQRYEELIGEAIKLKFKVDKRRPEWWWQPICKIM